MGNERIATLASILKIMHDSKGHYVMANPVGNLNVYSAEHEWIGIIHLTSVEAWNTLHPDDPYPDASWGQIDDL